MLAHFRWFACPLLLLIVSGCASSLTTSVESRLVTAKAPFPNHVGEGGSTPDEAAINIGGRLFLVSSGEVKWSGSGSLNDPLSWKSVSLPASWQRVQLGQSAAGVAVVVDGRSLTVVRPGA